MIFPSLNKTSLAELFNVKVNNSIVVNKVEEIKAYANAKEGYVTWICSLCGKEGITQEENFLSSVLERANAHYYCRCTKTLTNSLRPVEEKSDLQRTDRSVIK